MVELAQAGIDQATILNYARLSWDSPLAPKILAVETCTPVTDEMMIPRPVFQHSQFFQQWVRPNGFAKGMFGNLAPMPHETVGHCQGKQFWRFAATFGL